MKRKKIAVAGSEGFIGSHVMKQLLERNGEFDGIAVPRRLWESPVGLAALLAECDAVIMLAGISRSDDGEALYRTNMELVQKLADAVKGTACRIIFGSTTHEAKQTAYHASKRDGAALLEAAEAESVTVLMPNTFGPGGKPFYNSVVSTFCCQAARGETMTVAPGAGEVLLIDVQTLAAELIALASGDFPGKRVVLEHRFAVSVREMADLLGEFREKQKNTGNDEFSALLYETFESYKKQENQR